MEIVRLYVGVFICEMNTYLVAALTSNTRMYNEQGKVNRKTQVFQNMAFWPWYWRHSRGTLVGH